MTAPSEPVSIETTVAAVAEGMAQMSAALEPLTEGARGYRERLKREGWSDTASERMAMDLHSALLRKMFA